MVLKVDGGSDFILLSFFNLLVRSDETLSIWDFQFSLVSTVIPRHLELDTYFIVSQFKLIVIRLIEVASLIEDAPNL